MNLAPWVLRLTSNRTTTGDHFERTLRSRGMGKNEHRLRRRNGNGMQAEVSRTDRLQ